MIATDRNRPQKHVQRARIVLLSAERLPVAEVARQVGVSRPAVWRWQTRYAEVGVDALLHDRTRPPGTAPLPTETVARLLALTCSDPPGQVTHWTGRAMAKAVGVSLRSVQRIWDAHRLQPHRLRMFKRSNDPVWPAFGRTRPLPRRSRTSSASTWRRRCTPSCCPSTRSRRSRRSTAHSPGCRSSWASAAP